MSKDTRIDRTYVAATGSPLIAELQKMVAVGDGQFPWSQMLNAKEVRFVYDMLAWAEARSDFMPNTLQGRWGVQILWKLTGSAKEWQAAQTTQLKKVAKTKRAQAKKGSTRPDLVARRDAIALLKRHKVRFDKSSPSNVELAHALHSLGLIKESPGNATAKQLLIEWSGSSRYWLSCLPGI
ncbi:hypothetical protein J3P95_16470 [Pseudomonas sp. Z5-35]|uniref:hypothetical protein n=1 Tax=unclassified Pseudomonas TaxID=196821 RepID=UPI003DA87740